MSSPVGIVIPAYNNEKNLAGCLPPLLQSTVPVKILLVDSSSTDRTTDVARSMGVEILTIPRTEFNHGTTREMARKRIATDIVVMISADAFAVDNSLIENLIKPIEDGDAAVSYARQLAHVGAGLFEAFPREFNYPDEFQLRSIHDVDKYGVYTIFCSNSCAAYSNKALDKIGGFKPTLTNEDYFATAELLQAGYKIAYVPEAVVRHSHRYRLINEFTRYFDAGYVRAERPWVQQLVGHADQRGLALTKALLKRIIHQNILLLPYAVLQTGAKWAGYKIGLRGLNLPLGIKKSLSSQKYYWDSEYYQSLGAVLAETDLTVE